MFREIAGVATVAAAGATIWAATQGVSPGELLHGVGEMLHGVEHMTVEKNASGGWQIRIDDPGDEVGFVKAMHDHTAFGDHLDAAEMLDMGHRTCERLRNGSGPNDIMTWMNQDPKIANSGLSTTLIRKIELDLITNAQVYLCPDTLHNGTVGTPTRTPARVVGHTSGEAPQ